MSVLRRLRRGAPVVVVSGLPRAGTSMVMQMLHAGGMAVVSDGVREADEHNPRGYFELEAVKTLHEGLDPAWVGDARGKAVKVVSYLLTWLPEQYDYHVIFVERDLREVVASQQKMLIDRGEAKPPDDVERAIGVYAQHLGQVARFLDKRPCFTTLRVQHRRILDHPRDEALRISAFLGGRLNVEAMALAVAPNLYRHRGGAGT
jgi:hypothetical protein